MARRRSIRAGSSIRRVICVIYGSRPNGDLARISVYQKGSSVWLNGPDIDRAELVHPSNERNIEGWVREAALRWRLSGAYSEDPMSANDEDEKERYEELKVTIAE